MGAIIPCTIDSQKWFVDMSFPVNLIRLDIFLTLIALKYFILTMLWR